MQLKPHPFICMRNFINEKTKSKCISRKLCLIHDIMGWTEQLRCRGVNFGWAEWAIAYPGFGRTEDAIGQQQCTALPLAHPVLNNYLRPCVMLCT